MCMYIYLPQITNKGSKQKSKGLNPSPLRRALERKKKKKMDNRSDQSSDDDNDNSDMDADVDAGLIIVCIYDLFSRCVCFVLLRWICDQSSYGRPSEG